MQNEKNFGSGNSADPLALAPREAARALGVSPRTLWAHTKAGTVPHVRLGRRILYPVRELREWLAGRTAAGATASV